MKFLWLLLLPMLSFAADNQRVKALYNSLDIRSVAQHLALYELFPDTPEGKMALSYAWQLLTKEELDLELSLASLSSLSTAIEALISLVNKQPNGTLPQLDEKGLEMIEKMAARLPNRQLKGHNITTEEETLALPWNEIDLARSLFLTEMQDRQKSRLYEAMIDLMALQILARFPPDATPKEKLKIINSFIFEELGFRFPPQSLSVKDVDLYTFLPSVLDSRRGVCLGVSILYLCLSQRLNLSLETVTPPGHIYVRYREGDEIINIETTARGVNTESETYLGIETRSLQLRNIKEVVGLAHVNQAAVHWHRDENEKALASYRIALKYLPEDMLLKEFMAFNYLIVGEKEKGIELLNATKDHLPDYAVTKDTLAEDYLSGKVDPDSFKSIFMSVDEKRESLLKKKEALTKAVEKYPQFRAGLYNLATTWMQLHRHDEALKYLEKLHEIDPNQPSAEYYMAVLYTDRLDYNKAWAHLTQAEKIVQDRGHKPKALKELRRELEKLCPH
jgi:regulator of sirC expression with transglutaminase-like and TPR domain